MAYLMTYDLDSWIFKFKGLIQDASRDILDISNT